MRIIHKLTLQIILPVIFIFFILGELLYSQSVFVVDEQIQERFEVIAAAIEHQLNNQIDYVKKEISTLATIGSLKDMGQHLNSSEVLLPDDKRKALENVLIQYAQTQTAFRTIEIVRFNGEGLVNITDGNPVTTYTALQDPVWGMDQLLKNRDDFHLSQVFVDDKTLLMSVSHLIYDHVRAKAAIRIVIDVHAYFGETLDVFSSNRPLQFYLLDSSRRILTGSYALRSDEALLNLQRLLDEGVKFSQRKFQLIDEQVYYFVDLRTEDFDLIIVEPEEYAFADVRKIQMLTLVALLITAVLIMSLIVVSVRNMDAPIKALGKLIKGMANGHGDIAVKDSQRCDFPYLVDAVETVSCKLQAMIQSRENMLEEIEERKRSEEGLRNKNKELVSDEERLRLSIEQLRDRNVNLRNTQQELVKSEKKFSNSELAATVAQEINDPLSFVSNNLHVLRKYWTHYEGLINRIDALKMAVHKKNPEEIDKACNNLEQYEDKIGFQFIKFDVENLLCESFDGIGRVRQNILKFREFSFQKHELQKIHVAELVDTVIGIVFSDSQNEIEIKKVYEIVPSLLGDRHKLGQAFIHILMNAKESIEGVGVITVHLYQKGKLVWIEVKDTGKGIAEKIRDRIFEPFFTTKTLGHGMGLGLNISDAIIRKHGGEILFDSQEGRGTNFKIVLPIGTGDESV